MPPLPPRSPLPRISDSLGIKVIKDASYDEWRSLAKLDIYEHDKHRERYRLGEESAHRTCEEVGFCIYTLPGETELFTLLTQSGTSKPVHGTNFHKVRKRVNGYMNGSHRRLFNIAVLTLDLSISAHETCSPWILGSNMVGGRRQQRRLIACASKEAIMAGAGENGQFMASAEILQAASGLLGAVGGLTGSSVGELRGRV